MDKMHERFVKGMLPLIVLKEIDLCGSIHGYSLIRTIRQRTGIYLGPSTMYPFLINMERDGYVSSVWGMNHQRPVKSYSLTAKGKTLLGLTVKDVKVLVQSIVTIEA